MFGDSTEPPIVRHHAGAETFKPPRMKVLYRDMKTGQWLGPAEVICLGRGYACVSSPTGAIWVPSRRVKPAVEDTGGCRQKENIEE